MLTSRKTLLILTPDYLQSQWTEFENLLLRTLEPTNQNLRLIPLLKARCDLPLRLRMLTYVNFVDPDEWDFAWRQLLVALGAQPIQETPVQETPATWNLAQLRDYFAAVPAPDKVQKLDDLQPVIELYHHTVRAGQYDEACDLLSERLVPNPLDFQFGAYQLAIELLRALFPDGEDRPPHLKREDAQAWALNTLASSYSLSGQPRRAIPLFEGQNTLREKAGDKKNLAIGLGHVATQQLIIGALRAAETNLRRRIDLCHEIEDEFSEAVGHQELGRLLAYRGAWAESEQELATALALAEKQQCVQMQGITWADRALLMVRALPSPVERGLLDGRGAGGEGLTAARRALEFADEDARTDYPVERDYVRAHWLLGAAHRLNGELDQAEQHLSEALSRCRNIDMVDHEAYILLDLARLSSDQGDRKEALRLAQEALLITERSGYVLQGADVQLFLAQEALKDNDRAQALQHAREARRLATCDGPPDYIYKVAYDEAGQLLVELEDKYAQWRKDAMKCHSDPTELRRAGARSAEESLCLSTVNTSTATEILRSLTLAQNDTTGGMTRQKNKAPLTASADGASTT